MKSIVSKIIRKFELSVSEKYAELEVYSELVLRSVNGVVLNIEERKRI